MQTCFINQWLDWFAWHPITTMSGRTVWLVKVQRRWSENVNPWCDSSGYSGTDGGYEYRLPLAKSISQ